MLLGMRNPLQTFFFHDYETWGLQPAVDRPWQFAGIRTDGELNVIDEATTVYCQPPADLLPSPEACLVTGVVPQDVRESGLSERAFSEVVHHELSRPGTCGVGYNNFDFDDEVTRHLFYRNFYEPYAREWQDGNSRWDLVDVVRACYALRPEGIAWPVRKDGCPSFKLEHLAAENGLGHEQAHDARSDVLATLELARLIRAKQPRLFKYLVRLRDRQFVESALSLSDHTPVLHISGKFPAVRGCGALLVPLIRSPTDKNAIVCFDLASDPEALLTLEAEEIHRRVFTPSAELDVERIALMTVRINRSPVLVPERVIDERIARQMHIDRVRCARHRQRLLEAPGLFDKLREVIAVPYRDEVVDPEQALYAGGFISSWERALFPQLRAATPQRLGALGERLKDRRLRELLFRYRARNFPESLEPEERARWRRFCHDRLTNPACGAGLTIDLYRHKLDQLEAARSGDEDRALLRQLRAYGERLCRAPEPI